MGTYDRTVANKEDNFLISPAVFDPNRTEAKYRGRDNILHLRNLWLDFEEGDLRSEDIARLFPDVRMVITNSFNHTEDRPRFRVVIPTTQTLTPEAYEALFDYVVSTRNCFCGCRPLCKRFWLVWSCDRVRTSVRPLSGGAVRGRWPVW